MNVILSVRGRRVYNEAGQCVKVCRSEAEAGQWVRAAGRHKPRRTYPKGRYAVSRITGFVPGLGRYHTRVRTQVDEAKRLEELNKALNATEDPRWPMKK